MLIAGQTEPCEENDLQEDNFTIALIEINSYGMRSGAALFDWDNDYHQLMYGPFEFRVL